MNRFFTVIIVLVFAASALAQMPDPSPSRRPRVVSGSGQQSSSSMATATPTPYIQSTPKSAPTVIVTNSMPSATPSPKVWTAPTPSPTPVTTSTVVPMPTPLPSAFKLLSLSEIKNKLAEARRIMQTRPMPTAMVSGLVDTGSVRLAFYDWKNNQVDMVILTKPFFLSRDSEVSTISSNGRNVRVRIVRANGVNTAVTIFNETNQPHTPLIVQYPIEKGGAFREMAYYISAHPGLTTPEVFAAGKLYVRNMIDVARMKLKEKGIFISPQVADVAERLSTVEHVDHQRFWSENQPNLFNEIFALYALNESNTYRYSVSSAGAGGMVQMIPSTYYMIRSRYYNVGLIPDFVEGMRNHQNAAQAMLLYMQMTWNDLIANETVYSAYTSGIASQADLLAAGYNSNPAKIAGYIRRAGSNWRALIPRETKIYLQIYESLDRAVPMTPRGL